MKSLKRIMSCVLSLLLLLNMCFVFAEEEAEKVYGKEAIGIINVLGIAEYTEENLTEDITRGEFFKLASKLAGIEGTVDGEILYKDLLLEHEFEPYIKALTRIGVISGDENGNVLADEKISLVEAASVVLKLAGYGVIADAKGGFPNGYYSTAKLQKMFYGIDIDADAPLTKGMAAQLIRNSLQIKLMGPDSFTSDGSYTIQENGTFLWSVFKIYHLKDVVNGVDITRLMGNNDINPFWIQVGNLELESRGIEDIYSYLGYLVDLYYVHERGKHPQAVYIQKSKDNDVAEINIEDVESIKGNKIEFYENDKLKSYTFKNGIPVVYNGASTKDAFSMTILKTNYTDSGSTKTRNKHGKIRLVDNTRDGRYDVAFIDAYENFVISHVDKSEKYIYDKYDATKKLSVDIDANNPYTIIYDVEGEETDADSLSADQVVAVYHSAPDAYQQYVRIYILDNIVMGKIEKLRKNSEYVTIDGKEYRVNIECRAAEKDKLKIGSLVKAFLDVDGRIAYIVYATETEYMYGFIVDIDDQNNGLSSDLLFKIYSTNDTFSILKVADKILLDGDKYDRGNAIILTRLNQAADVMFGDGVPDTSYSSIVRYKLNAKGEICAIDTLINGDTEAAMIRREGVDFNDMLFMTSSTGAENYYRTWYTAGPQVAMKKETPVIMHPSPIPTFKDDMSDENLYICGTAYNALPTGKKLALNAFYTNPDTMTADVISYPRGFLKSSVSVIAGVKDTFVEWDDKYEKAVDCLVVYDANGEQRLHVKPGTTYSVKNDEGETESRSVQQLGKGDCIKYTVNIDGYITAVSLYYAKESDTVVTGSSGNYMSEPRIMYGYVYDVFDDGYMVYPTDSTDRSVLNNVTYADCVFVTTRYEVGYYAKTDKLATGDYTVVGGNFEDLKGYKDVGKDFCSRVIVETTVGRAYGVYIFE